jgi:hypothetical protein
MVDTSLSLSLYETGDWVLLTLAFRPIRQYFSLWHGLLEHMSSHGTAFGVST